MKAKIGVRIQKPKCLSIGGLVVTYIRGSCVDIDGKLDFTARSSVESLQNEVGVEEFVSFGIAFDSQAVGVNKGHMEAHRARAQAPFIAKAIIALA